MIMMMMATSSNNKGHKYKEKRKLRNKTEEKEVSNFGGSVKTPVKMDKWMQCFGKNMT